MPGRGEPIRLAFRIGGIDFEDVRISMAEWPQKKATYPFGVLPVLEVNGKTLGNSNTILQYVGKVCGLAPEDLFTFAKVDEYLSVVEDLATALGVLRKTPDANKAAVMEELKKTTIPHYLALLEKTAIQNGGPYAVGSKLTVADLKLYVLVSSIKAGKPFPQPGALDATPTLLSIHKLVQEKVDTLPEF
uniref:GST N-terminal domain-containing protein n=1 Tax=Arcella intermedia TaxID=1963864 RepID=A0A6B2LJG1_9EUKA